MAGADDWQVVSSDVTVTEGAWLCWVWLAWRRGFSSQSLSDPTADAFRFLLEALGLESSSSWRAVNKGHFKHNNDNNKNNMGAGLKAFMLRAWFYRSAAGHALLFIAGLRSRTLAGSWRGCWGFASRFMLFGGILILLS